MNKDDLADDDLSETQEDGFVDRFRQGRSDADLRRLEILARVHEQYLCTKKDIEMAAQLASLIENSLRTHGQRRLEGRALIVVGNAGAGKSWAVQHAIEGRPEFEEEGDYLPFASVIAPSPCTLKQLGREVLRSLGYPLERDLKEHMIWEKVRERMKARRVRVMWIDEMHHAMRDTDAQKLRDTIKNVMQQKDWPVSFILSGLPLLDDFIAGDFQLQRRKSAIRLQDLQFPSNHRTIRQIVQKVVETHAGMTPADDLAPDEFLHRLQHAACGRFGMIVTLVRSAVEKALTANANANSVCLADFSAAYRAQTGCDLSQDIFFADRWHEIDPERLMFGQDEETQPEQRSRPIRSRLRSTQP